jgi:hypothetical protein
VTPFDIYENNKNHLCAIFSVGVERPLLGSTEHFHPERMHAFGDTRH